MCSPKAPTPPDPKVTAGAQTSTNLSTAIGNNAMGQVNQYRPGSSLEYQQRGTQKVTDPNTGMTYDVPQYSAITNLTGKEWDAYSANQGARVNLAETARDQSAFLKDYMGNRPTNEFLQNRQYIPQSSNFVNQKGNANLDGRAAQGGNVQGQVAGAGNIQQNIASGGDITRSYGTDFSQDRQRVEDALMQRMQPSLDRDRDQLETRLANQGIGYGTAAYSAAMDDFNRGASDSRLGAILAGGQEQSRMTGLEAQRAGFQNAAQAQRFGQNATQAQFSNAGQAQRFGQNMAGGQFANQAQQQRFGQDAANIQMQNAARQAALDNTNRARGANNAIAGTLFGQNMQRAGMADSRRNAQMQEQFAYRNQPINEITALMSGSQVQAPNFQQYQPQGMPTVDYAGLINQNYGQQMGTYQQQMGQSNSLMGGLFGAAGKIGAGLIGSDRRIKKDISRIGMVGSLPFYSFRYKGEEGELRTGFMADEVEQIAPDAVVTGSDGIKRVDYGKALRAAQ